MSTRVAIRSAIAVFAASLVACSAPAKKPALDGSPPVGNLAPPVDTYCPPIHGLGPWHSEVFPACPAPPIADWLHVCEPGACPEPCEMSSDIADNMGMGTHYSRWLYRYDERGRWIETRSGDDKPDPADTSTCVWEGDRIARCTLRGKAATVERDASGRITRATFEGDDGPASVDVTYGARGEVIAVGDSTLRYDDRGRLAGFVLGKDARRRAGDTVLERDASGNVMREIGPLEIKTFTYDADRRRVREAVSKLKPWKLSSELPPVPPGPDAVTTAGARWGEDDICMMCPEGAIDPPTDPETERREMLQAIEERADIHSIGYEGANVVFVARGERGPQRRDRHYSYDCSPSK